MTVQVLRNVSLRHVAVLLSVTATLLLPCGKGFRVPFTKDESQQRKVHQKRGSCPEKDASISGDMCSLVLPQGYPLEEHTVTTTDGYILTMYRIPNGHEGVPASWSSFDWRDERRAKKSGKPVVLLQHGLLDSSAAWVLNGPNVSLGFMLADRGFDVWLANSRGNRYSKRHQTLATDSDAYWQFSYDEMASYDIPSTISYILTATGVNKISYVGHSQGTTIAFAALSNNRELASRVSMAVMLAPVAFITHTTSSALELLSRFDTAMLFKLLGAKEVLPSSIAPLLLGRVCQDMPCKNILTMLCGYNPSNINATEWPVYLTYTPAGTSIQNIIHWTQGVKLHNQTRFQKFDFGRECFSLMGRPKDCNQDRYGQQSPTAYNVSDMQVPVALFTGGQDKMSDLEDNQLLAAALPRGVVLFEHEEPSYEHLDFTWGINAHVLIYPHVIRLLTTHSFDHADVVRIIE